MKQQLIFIYLSLLASSILAQNTEIIKLSTPNKKGGMPIMEALSLRSSSIEFDSEDINSKVLSNLLWAANGINRDSNGKRTAPSALNAKDIGIYIFDKQGIFLYIAEQHGLSIISKKDSRTIFQESKNSKMPSTIVLLVSDISCFRFGDKHQRLNWGAIDAGMIAQNILLFGAANQMLTRPTSSMPIDKIKDILKLNKAKYPMINIFISNESKNN